jgi:hypothetical protein
MRPETVRPETDEQRHMDDIGRGPTCATTARLPQPDSRVAGPASGSLQMENPAQDQLLSGAKVAPSTTAALIGSVE